MSNMTRSSFIVALILAILVAWSSNVAAAKALVKSNQQEMNVKFTDSVTTRRYLKGSTAATEDAVTDAKDEERLSIPGSSKVKELLQKIPGVSKIKAAFQNDPSFAKNLEKFRQKRQSLNEFFKENPAIKKEIIVASVILTLLFSVPLVVNSFYPA